jgi:hypothetical protein
MTERKTWGWHRWQVRFASFLVVATAAAIVAKVTI